MNRKTISMNEPPTPSFSLQGPGEGGTGTTISPVSPPATHRNTASPPIQHCHVLKPPHRSRVPQTGLPALSPFTRDGDPIPGQADPLLLHPFGRVNELGAHRVRTFGHFHVAEPGLTQFRLQLGAKKMLRWCLWGRGPERERERARACAGESVGERARDRENVDVEWVST